MFTCSISSWESSQILLNVDCDPSCTSRTCARWHCIKHNMCVRILWIVVSRVDCSWKITPARSSRTWFLFTSSWDLSQIWALRNPMPQNWRYLSNRRSSLLVKQASLALLMTCATPITSQLLSYNIQCYFFLLNNSINNYF